MNSVEQISHNIKQENEVYESKLRFNGTEVMPVITEPNLLMPRGFSERQWISFIVLPLYDRSKTLTDMGILTQCAMKSIIGDSVRRTLYKTVQK